MPYRKDLFLASLDRCRAKPGFTQAFYSTLLDTDEAIRNRFRFTKFEEQVQKFDEALDICITAVDGDPDGLARLRELGRSHDMDHHNILPEWYPIWVESMVATATECDPKWDAETEEAWRTILGQIASRVASFYNG